MNYLEEITAFADWLETNSLDSITQVLWYHLMAINNKCHSPKWFAVANLTLQAKLRVNKKTIIKHRNILIQKQLIAYKNQGREPGRYHMLSVSALMGAPAGDSGGNIPPHQGPNAEIGEDTPPYCSPIQVPIEVPNRELQSSLYILNKSKTKNQDIYTIFEHWNAQRIITHRIFSPQQRGHIKARLAEGYTVDEILAAIDNYAEVVHGDQYYWTHKWRLDEFLLRGLDKFKTESEPRTNFLKDQAKTPGQAQGGADKYAGYVNRTIGYDDF